MNDDLKRTVFYDRHVELNATMVDFGGWNMPVQYQNGILQEHLATRNQAGLFDVSHMGRFIISGSRALDFLQHVLSNNAAGLEVEESQYTMIPNENGGAVDDAYLRIFTGFTRMNICWWSTPPTAKRTGSIFSRPSNLLTRYN